MRLFMSIATCSAVFFAACSPYYVGEEKIGEVEKILLPYKPYLDKGSYEGYNMDNPVLPATRYHTFLFALSHFVAKKDKVIVELGTTRSYVTGGVPGCNSNDAAFWDPKNPSQWDFGAGFFTRMAAECLAHQKYVELHTVDIAKEHLERCHVMTQKFPFVRYHCDDSILFLCLWPENKKIDLLYFDTGDLVPVEYYAEHQLGEAKIVVERDLIADNGLILINNVRHKAPGDHGELSPYGKSKYALPYLLDHGFEIVVDEYQVILRKRPLSLCPNSC